MCRKTEGKEQRHTLTQYNTYLVQDVYGQIHTKGIKAQLIDVTIEHFAPPRAIYRKYLNKLLAIHRS